VCYDPTSGDAVILEEKRPTVIPYRFVRLLLDGTFDAYIGVRELRKLKQTRETLVFRPLNPNCYSLSTYNVTVIGGEICVY